MLFIGVLLDATQGLVFYLMVGIDMYVPCWTELIAEPYVYRSMLLRRFQKLEEELSIHLNSIEIRSKLRENNIIDLGYSESYFRERIRSINEMNRIGMYASGVAFYGFVYPMLNADDLYETHRILKETLERLAEAADNIGSTPLTPTTG